jgi:hypothetical protein
MNEPIIVLRKNSFFLLPRMLFARKAPSKRIHNAKQISEHRAIVPLGRNQFVNQTKRAEGYYYP